MARAERRLAALCEIRSRIASYRSQAEKTALSVGVSNQYASVAQIPTPVTLTTTVNLVAGYAHLYSLTVKAAWEEGAQSETVSSQTYVRAPND